MPTAVPLFVMVPVVTPLSVPVVLVVLIQNGCPLAFTVKVKVTNTGDKQGKEAVLLFVSDEVASISPPVKLLKRFKKINLLPGQEQEIYFTLTKDDLQFVDRNNKWVFEPGYFTLAIGDQKKRVYVGH